MTTAFAKDTLYNLWVSTGHVRIVYSGVVKAEPVSPGGQKLSTGSTLIVLK